MQNPGKPFNKIGDILVQCGMVTPVELDEALVLAHKEHIRLGEALVKLGVLGESQLIWALGIQFDLTHVELSHDMIDWDLVMQLPTEQLHGLMVLPLVPDESPFQRVVIADPTVEGLKEFIEGLFGDRQVLVQLASAVEMDEVFEEVGRRRHRVVRSGGARAPWTPPPANALLRWLPRLESGRIERVVVRPAGRDEYEAVTYPRTGEGAERLSAGELKTILERVYDYFLCDSPCAFVTNGLRGAGRMGESHAVRAVVLRGMAGDLLALEGISTALLRRVRRRIPLLACKDPAAVKTELLARSATLRREEASASALVVSLESRVDFLVPGVFQAELCDPQVRVSACRDLIGAARPAVLVVEAESEEEARRLPVEAGSAEAGRFFVIQRSLVSRMSAASLPDGVDRIEIPADPHVIRSQVEALLRGPAGGHSSG